MNTKLTLILSLFLTSILFCSDEDHLVIAKGNITINKGITEFNPKRNLHEVAHFSGIIIQLPDSITVNLNSKKLKLKNGEEFNIYAELIDKDNNNINCKIESMGPASVALGTPSYSNTEVKYKKVIINSEISFHTTEIEWYSTDKF